MSAPIGLFRAARYPLRGLRFIFVSHRRLAVYWVPPLLITLVGMGVGGWFALREGEALLSLFWSPSDPPATPIGGSGLQATIQRWLQEGLGWLRLMVSWLLRLALLIMAVLAGYGVSTIVAAPFNDALSRRVELEQVAGGEPLPEVSIWRDALRSIKLEFLKWSLLVLVLGPLFVLSLLVPGAGQVLYGAVATLVAMLYFALDFLDWPAARRGWAVRRRLELFHKHPREMLGFGAAVWVLMWVPGLNLLLMPGAVVGGTMLFLELSPDSRQ